MPDSPRFLFITCQVGAEGAVKTELARRYPDFRLAFSRPGFITFKLPEEHGLADDFVLRSVFARSYGFSLGKCKGDDPDTLARGVWDVFGDRSCDRIHVWQRDTAEPGQGGFEPWITPLAVEAADAIRRHCPDAEMLVDEIDRTDRPARFGQTVLDCVLVEPGEWWVGMHQVKSTSAQWPGAIMPISLPADAVSRAWLKMEEALRWSLLPIPEGAHVAEIGSAPGGSVQALLARGFIVTGVDPAMMHPTVLKHENFTHIRRRASTVRRRDYRKVRWLTADINAVPKYTLDAVEAVVMDPRVSIRGLILTLKPPTWDLASNVPEYLDRINGWGFNVIRARQLVHNHREICVAALQEPFRRKW